jgi:hypothetical protein
VGTIDGASEEPIGAPYRSALHDEMADPAGSSIATHDATLRWELWGDTRSPDRFLYGTDDDLHAPRSAQH